MALEMKMQVFYQQVLQEMSMFQGNFNEKFLDCTQIVSSAKILTGKE